MADMTRCALCGRDVFETTDHHLIPRTRHSNKRNKRDFDRDAVRRVVPFCRPCHKTVHAVLTEKELEREYNTVERLREHPEMASFIAWVRTRPPDATVTVREHGAKKRRRRDARRRNR